MSNDVHTVALNRLGSPASHHQHRRYVASGARSVIGAQVTRITEGLIERCLGRVKGAFYFQYGNATTLEEMTSGRLESRGSSYSRIAVYSCAVVSRTSSSRHSRCNHGMH